MQPRIAPRGDARSRAGPASSPRSTWARTASGSRSASCIGGRYRRIDYLKETVRLGAGLDAAGLLERRGGDARPRLPGPLRAAPRRLRGEPGARGRDPDAARSEEPRRLPAARPGVLGQPIEIISGREEARLIFAGVARLQPSNRAAAGHRHRRSLDRDDPRPRRAAAPGRVVPGRQRQPVDEVLPRRPLQRARASARRRSPPAPSSRKRSARSRRATGARRSARRARSARCRRCSPRAARRRHGHARGPALADGALPRGRQRRPARSCPA